MLGVIEDLSKVMDASLKNVGSNIFLIGNDRVELGGSEYLKQVANIVSGEAPILNLDNELALQNCILDLIDKRLVNSAHDTSEGGIAIALTEMAMLSENNIGFKIESLKNNETEFFFGESQSRILVEVSNENLEQFEQVCENLKVSTFKLGNTISNKVCFGKNEFDIKEVRALYENAIPQIMNK